MTEKRQPSWKGARINLFFKIFPKFLHLGEETFGLGAMRAPAASLIELSEQLALLFGQINRRFHLRLDIHVAARIATQHRHAFRAQAELLRQKIVLTAYSDVSTAVVMGMGTRQ